MVSHPWDLTNWLLYRGVLLIEITLKLVNTIQYNEQYYVYLKPAIISNHLIQHFKIHLIWQMLSLAFWGKQLLLMNNDHEIITVQLLCGLCGYHVHIYQSVWTLKLQQVLDALQESNSPYNQYVIAAWKRASFTWFITIHGAVICL